MFERRIHAPERGYAEGFDHGYDAGFEAAQLLNFDEIDASSDATEQISRMPDEQLDFVPVAQVWPIVGSAAKDELANPPSSCSADR